MKTRDLLVEMLEWAERVPNNNHPRKVLKYLLGTAPHGAGLDDYVRVEADAQKIVVRCNFHHMNSDGYYTKWTEHALIFRPVFGAGCVCTRITGRNFNGIHTYLFEVFDQWLNSDVDKEALMKKAAAAE